MMFACAECGSVIFLQNNKKVMRSTSIYVVVHLPSSLRSTLVHNFFWKKGNKNSCDKENSWSSLYRIMQCSFQSKAVRFSVWCSLLRRFGCHKKQSAKTTKEIMQSACPCFYILKWMGIYVLKLILFSHVVHYKTHLLFTISIQHLQCVWSSDVVHFWEWCCSLAHNVEVRFF